VTRVSVVTGAAGAMGSVCARAVAADVDVLLLTDCHEERLKPAARQLEAETDAAVSTVIGDIADPAVVADLVARVDELGDLHALVHTAGVSPSMAGWEEILRVDLVGTARLLDAFLTRVLPGSVAVCIASIAGHIGAFDPDMDAVLDASLAADLEARYRTQFGDEPDPGSTYRLAKRGVIRQCERSAVTWGTRGGRVVSLSPGLIDTDMGRLELVNNPIKDTMVDLTPIRSRAQEPDAPLPGSAADIADAVAFLCSASASFISGCDLRVDGGLIAAMNHPV
jgi:NAD(P)-dependent dehydrogenase (short-subunit alcohol dehydrogenase family)